MLSSFLFWAPSLSHLRYSITLSPLHLHPHTPITQPFLSDKFCLVHPYTYSAQPQENAKLELWQHVVNFARNMPEILILTLGSWLHSTFNLYLEVKVIISTDCYFCFPDFSPFLQALLMFLTQSLSGPCLVFYENYSNILRTGSVSAVLFIFYFLTFSLSNCQTHI